MAGNMDENEIKGVAEAMNELREKGQLSADTLAKLGSNSTTAYKALEGYTKSLLGATGAIGGMAKAVAQGEGTFASMGSSIVGLTSVVGKLASAIPLVGGAAKALAEGVGEAAKFVLDQLDIMAKNYQTLGDASAGAADGVDGLLRQFNQMGNYSLPAFTKAVKANTLGLAAFQGTAAEGAEELSKVSGALTTGDTAKRFLKLGMSLDAVGDTATEYISTFSRLGLLQGDTTDELTKKTQNYIVEVDKIARLTGQTREAQQREAQKSLTNARFRATILQMEANGQKDQAAELTKYVNGLGGAYADAARAYIAGIPATKEGALANQLTNDALRQNISALKDGKKATEAIVDTQDAAADGAVRYANLVKNAGDVMGGVFVQSADIEAQLRASGKSRQQRLDDADKAIQNQTEASGEMTEKFTNAQLSTANASKNLQSLGFSLATYAVPAVDKFATALDSVTGLINKNFGVGGSRSTPAGVNRGAPGGSAGGQYSNSLLDLIGRGESRGNYNALVGGGSANLTKMTVAEVQQLQQKMLREGRASSAVGKYQMISSTLSEQMKKAGLDPSTTKFDEKTQDLLAQQLINQAGYGKKDTATVMKNLARTWASLPKDMSGAGAYDGYNTNRANINPNELAAAISGPSSRFDKQVSSIDPVTSAGSSTQAQADQNANKTPTAAESNMWQKSFTEMTALLRQNNAQNAKLIQGQRT